MSDLAVGLLCWLGVGIVSGVLVGRFMRLPEVDEVPQDVRARSGFLLLPRYGREEERIETQAESDRVPQ